MQPPGRWLLWGSELAASIGWGEHVPAGGDPRRLAGQAELRRVPHNDVAIYLHQIRPLRPGTSLTVIHDTIPLRYGGSAPTRLLKRVFFEASARLSTGIVTVSRYAKESIVADLGVTPDKINVVTYPRDEQLAARVRELRARFEPRNVALYVGSFAPHKNLERLIDAFGRTEFARKGGRLHLVGEASQRADVLRARGGHGTVVEGPCSQSRLEELYATSRLLVVPSLEEGFGLPAWEAICCGLPVAASNGGSLPEATHGLAETFRPTNDVELAAAVDRAAEAAPPVLPDAPSIAEFAAEFVAAAKGVAHT